MFKYVFSCFFCDILQSLDLNLQWYLIVHIFLIDSFLSKKNSFRHSNLFNYNSFYNIWIAWNQHKY